MHPTRLLAAFAVSAAIILLFSCSSTSEAPALRPDATPPADGPETPPVQSPAEPLPADPENAAEVLESFYNGIDDTEAAIAALQDADVSDMDADSRLVYAVLLRAEGRLDEARDELEDIVLSNPEMASAWFNLALVEHAAGRGNERDAALSSTIAADDSMVEAHTFRAALASESENWPVAEAAYRRVLDLEPESVDALAGLAWVMAKNDQLEFALLYLNEAVELEPDNSYALVDRSRVNVALGNYNDAEDDLTAVIAMEPDVSWHYLDRTRIRLRHFKDYDGALEDLAAVERLDPGNFFAQVYLAGVHDELGRYSLAREYYRKVTELRPDYIWAYMPLGKLAWMAGDFREAAEWYRRAAEEDDEAYTFALMEALSLQRNGSERDAAPIFRRVLASLTQGSTAYEVVRFCAEGGTDFYAVNALNRESDETLRERLWFYMGAAYENEGNNRGAEAVFERLSSRMGEMEYDLARAALYGMDG